MDGPIKHLVVVGGGTAGWLTASLLAADHCAHDPAGVQVTVIESAKVPILGVGEGTWPSLRDTLRRIGISETDFIRACEASFKQGSRFDGWRTGGAEDTYFHPFSAPPNSDDVDPLALWRAGPAGAPFAACASPQTLVCLENRAPKQAATPEYAAVTNYAYHLDAPAFAGLLRDHATNRLGVRLVIDDVVDVVRSEDGHVASVTTAEHGHVAGDLFVDCTGARALLIGEALGAELTDVSDVLFNDAALALHVPYPTLDAPIASQTNATAMAAGWVWDIGLQSRRGVGHVFSTRHASEDDARTALQSYLDRTALGVDVHAEEARLIRFRSAYRSQPWKANVVAVGMAQGFVEPLEASAIVMVELAAAMLSDTLPARRSLLAPAAERFNARFAYRWARIVDFLKLHYVLSERAEPYWAVHRDPATWPDRLRELMARWRYEVPSREDFPQTREIFPAASYAYVLYGMGFETHAAATRRRTSDPDRARRAIEDTMATARRYVAGLPTNRQLLAHITAKGLTRI